jgi:hypothetical protein
MGFAIGMGRLGGILSPILAGFLLDASFKPEHVFFVFAAPLLAAMASVLALRPLDAAGTTEAEHAALQAAPNR